MIRKDDEELCRIYSESNGRGPDHASKLEKLKRLQNIKQEITTKLKPYEDKTWEGGVNARNVNKDTYTDTLLEIIGDMIKALTN